MTARTRTRPSPTVTTALATQTVEVVKKDRAGAETTLVERNESVSVPASAVHATVHVAGRVTRSPARYESLTVTAGIWMPCEPTFEAADAMYRRCSDWVEQKIMREMAVALGQPTE